MMKHVLAILYLIAWAPSSFAQDRLLVGDPDFKFVRVNWFHGHQKDRDIEFHRFAAELGDLICRPIENQTIVSNAVTMRKVLADLDQFSRDKEVKKAILAKSRSSYCDIHLDVDVIGDFNDGHREFTYDYTWRLTGWMYQNHYQSISSTHANFRENLQGFLNGIPKSRICKASALVTNVDKKYQKLREDVSKKLIFGIPKSRKVAFLVDMSTSFTTLDQYSHKPYSMLAIFGIVAAIQSMDASQSFTISIFGGRESIDVLPYTQAGPAGAELATEFLETAVSNSAELGQKYNGNEKIAEALRSAKDASEIFLLSDGEITQEEMVSVKPIRLDARGNAKEIADALRFAMTQSIPIHVKKVGLRPGFGFVIQYNKDSKYPTDGKTMKFEQQADLQNLLKKINRLHLPFGHLFMNDLAALSGGKDLTGKFENLPSREELNILQILKEQAEDAR